ncbi:MAG: MFS transporter [Lachnospiraceae bacterium]|nr:MFS transporter [Lachnospiraceae bacterium]
MAAKKPTQSEIDGVQYRRAKLWQIILVACNAFVGMSVYSLIGYASYSASVGYGISTAIVGVILMGTRILDAVTDPLLAVVYDKVNTRFGKLRILLISGFLIEAVALLLMYDVLSSKGLGIPVFALLYCVYIIGYTITNMTAQTFGAIMTNDPKQRPVIGVWNTAFNYIVPITLSIVLAYVFLPMAGGTYNQIFLSSACRFCLLLGAVGIVLVCIGISAYDKPEYLNGVSKKQEPLKVRDMVSLLKDNRPLQCYIASAASDKLAQQVASQSVITTLLFGVIIGNVQLSTILSAVAMFPSIIFAIIGARYAGKHGSRKGVLVWTRASLIVALATVIFFIIIDPTQIAAMGGITVIYVLLNFALNGTKMSVTTCNTSFMADVIDYELDRSGKYLPALVTGTYSLVDKIVSSVSSVIATGAIALIGYVNTVPQPGDPSTPAVFWMTMALCFGLPVLGWICTLIAMRLCSLSKEEMVEVQKRIADKKTAAVRQEVQENPQ